MLFLRRYSARMEEDEKITRRFLPDIIRRCRHQAGLSQQQLADSVGVSKGFISALEGGRSAPSVDMLVQIADALGVSAGAIVDELVSEALKKV